MTQLVSMESTDSAPLKWLEPDRNPAAVYLGRLAPSSRRTIRCHLDTLARIAGFPDALQCPWHLMRFSHTSRLMALRRETADERGKLPSPATVNASKAALRMVMKTAWRLGLMASEDCHRACDLEAVRGGRLPRGRSLTAGQLRALFSTCEHASPSGARDGALLALLYGCGLRRAEVVALDLSDWNREAFQLRVRGKGDKERIAHTDAVTHVLEAWLRVRGDEPGALLTCIERRRPVLRRMSTQAVYFVVKRRAKDARIGDLSPHDLRRTFVGDLLEAGADLSQVQGLAGHSQVTTTQRYDRRPEQSRKKAAQKLWVPCRPAV